MRMVYKITNKRSTKKKAGKLHVYGGKGSGHFGHVGRPGQEGGSQKRSGKFKTKEEYVDRYLKTEGLKKTTENINEAEKSYANWKTLYGHYQTHK